MLLDLHTHSVKSDDGRAKVENYCKWIRKKEIPLDGFVLTEHRQFYATSDYRDLEDEYGLVILKASEVESDFGHILVFGVNEDLQAAIDFTDVRLPIGDVLEASKKAGAFAAPCHPGRKRVGLFSHYEERGEVDGVEPAALAEELRLRVVAPPERGVEVRPDREDRRGPRADGRVLRVGLGPDRLHLPLQGLGLLPLCLLYTSPSPRD